MRIKIYHILLIFLLLGTAAARSQERHTEICIDFRVNSSIIDSTYLNNAACIQKMMDFLREIRRDSTLHIVGVSFNGAASPEGSKQINTKLARGRLSAIEKLVRQEMNIPENLITRNDNYIPWEHFISLIKDSEYTWKDEVIAILNEGDMQSDDPHYYQRMAKLKALEEGRVWQQINTLFFQHMRNACAIFVTYKKELPRVQEPVIVPDTVVVAVPEPQPVIEAVEIAPDTVAVVETAVPEVEEWTRKLYVKTNLVGLGMAIANLGVEVDLAKHWSFALPVYYSAWDYFKSTVKFRTFAVQPELRYWLSENNRGFFAGAHFGLAYFNFAFDGDYRYQDHCCKTPALGGGLAVGYRMPISRNHRWHIEFLLGGGVYDLHYDVFHNVENVKNGKLKETLKDTYYGIDQAAINISYRFNLNKRRK